MVSPSHNITKEEADCEAPATPPPQPGGRRVSWANTAAVATVPPAPPLDDRPRYSSFRIALPQVLASSVKNLLLLDLGMVVAYPTILIPSLQNEPSVGALNLNDEQASWIGSIAYICQPVGAVLAGALLESLGRKRSMLLVNAPLLAGWLVFYWAATPAALYAACSVLGLSVGFMESSVVTYVGEISQPGLRGMLTSYAELCVSVGFFVEYLLGTVTDWRNAALISALLPVISALLITQVPETPIWLVSRGRTKDAEQALRWLRGWVPATMVQAELNDLCNYHKQSDAAEEQPSPATKVPPPGPTPPLAAPPDLVPEPARAPLRRLSADIMAPDEEAAAALAALHERHRGSQHFPVGLPAFVAPPKQAAELEEDDDEIAAWCESAACRKLTALLGRGTLRPMFVVLALFAFQCWAASTAVRSYAVHVCDEFGMPIDSHWATVATGATGIAGNLLCLVAVRWCGKRPLALASLALGAVCCVLLAAYAQARAALAPGAELPVGSWAPLLLFVLLYLGWSLGIGPIPWMLLSEVFPYRTRGLAAGLAAALSYVFAFSSAKTYLDLEAALGLHGAFYLFAAISVVGIVVVYFIMAETEGRTLEDIERYYSRPFEGSAEGQAPPPPALKKPNAEVTSEVNSEENWSRGANGVHQSHISSPTDSEPTLETKPLGRNGSLLEEASLHKETSTSRRESLTLADNHEQKDRKSGTKQSKPDTGAQAGITISEILPVLNDLPVSPIVKTSDSHDISCQDVRAVEPVKASTEDSKTIKDSNELPSENKHAPNDENSNKVVVSGNCESKSTNGVLCSVSDLKDAQSNSISKPANPLSGNTLAEVTSI